MPRAIKGVLVECDPAIKALALKIDARMHNIIIEDLDGEHLVAHESQVDLLKDELDQLLQQNVYGPESR